MPGPAHRPRRVVATLAGWLAERDLALGDLRTGQSLEEAYLAITGSRAADRSAGRRTPTRPGGRRRRGRGGPPAPMRPLTAQLRAEVTMIFTNGETVFLTLGIPVVFLLFFSAVHVLPTGAGTRSTSWSRASWPWPSCRRR